MAPTDPEPVSLASEYEGSDGEERSSSSQDSFFAPKEGQRAPAALRRPHEYMPRNFTLDSIPWAHTSFSQESHRRRRALLISVGTVVALLVIVMASVSISTGHRAKQTVISSDTPAVPLPKPVVPSGEGEVHAGPGATMHSCTTWPKDYLPTKTEDPEPLNATLSNAPPNMKVVGLIFYGRARYIDILECYLRRNLKAYGGVLDEMQFVVHTNKKTDLEYLDDLLKSEPDHFKKVEPPGHCLGVNYGCIWEAVTDTDTLYIKIDDDISYIHDDALRSLVQKRIDNPEPFGISGNIINTPSMTFLHYFSGAIHAFLPELERTTKRQRPSWRTSELPGHQDEAGMVTTKEITSPYQGHRWLPIHGPRPLLQSKTPIGQSINMDGVRFYDDFFAHWAPAAQQHFSLLHNIETGQMERYWFGQDAGLYDTQFIRYNLNFYAVWGRDIKAQLPIANDDEQELTVTIPQRTGRPHMIDLGAVVAHFQFNTQSEGVLSTDLLDRFRAYANEMVCTARNQKLPRDSTCPGFE